MAFVHCLLADRIARFARLKVPLLLHCDDKFAGCQLQQRPLLLHSAQRRSSGRAAAKRLRRPWNCLLGISDFLLGTLLSVLEPLSRLEAELLPTLEESLDVWMILSKEKVDV